MIKTGRPINVLLGHGDSERWNLLGGSNGTAGDVVLLTGGFGTRFFPNAKDKILRAAYQSYNPGGGSWGGGGRLNPNLPGREVAK